MCYNLLFTRRRCSGTAGWRTSRAMMLFRRLYLRVRYTMMTGIAINTRCHHHSQRVFSGLKKLLIDLCGHQEHMAYGSLFRFCVTRKIHFTGLIITRMTKITTYPPKKQTKHPSRDRAYGKVCF